jgi:Ca2+-binding RTX toxin-like protein
VNKRGALRAGGNKRIWSMAAVAALVGAMLSAVAAPLPTLATEPTPPAPVCTITGTAGDDTITGTAGDDVICGLAGNDIIDGAGGNDILIGGAGNDTLNGGDGTDAIDYTDSIYDLSINLVRGKAYGAGTDTLTSIESVTGGNGDDSIVGDDANNMLIGGPGDDTIYGAGGANLIDGGAGTDTVNYSSAATSITANLTSGVASVAATGNSPAATDALASIENVLGSAFGDNITGDQFANTLNGANGDDTISGASGNDLILGGAGADTLTGGDGIDTISFTGAGSAITASLAAGTATGDGNDTLSGFENIIGSSSADTLTGDAGANRINGGAGADSITGGGVPSGKFDLVDYSNVGAAVSVNLAAGNASGGGGNDSLTDINGVIGSNYNDTLLGGSVATLFLPGAGNDNVTGGAASDWVQFGNGLDETVNLTTGLATGEGNDFLTSIENVITGDGNDSVVGNSSDNILQTGAGADVVEGGPGNDTLNCGGDIDDTVSFAGATVAVTANLTTGVAAGVASGAGSTGTDTIIGCANLTGGAGNDVLTGTAGANIIDGAGGNDTIVGAAGDDVLIGGVGDDSLSGGAGSDTADYSDAQSSVNVNLTTGKASGLGKDTLTGLENIAGGSGKDILVGSSGANVILGGLGDDSIDGAAGSDTISFAGYTSPVTVSLLQKKSRGPGNDTFKNIENVLGGEAGDSIMGDAGANILDGGAGDDLLIGAAGNDKLIGGPGVDTASYADTSKAVVASLATGKASGGAGNDTFSTIENLTGGGDADTLTGDAGVNVIDGGAGKDKINGGDGDDSLRGGLGDDTINGGAGSDFADYSDLNTPVRANLATGKASSAAGNDTLTAIESLVGGGGNDLLIGDANDNSLDGGGGNDNLSGADGNDSLRGGFGNDLLVGGNGTDTADFSGSQNPVTASLVAGTAFGQGNDTVNGIENLTGGDGADTLTGDTSANVLKGGVGNDTLLGGDGADTLFGDSGNDRLDGGAGIDSVDGGSGRNICRTSDNGADVVSMCPFTVSFDVVEARFLSGSFTDASGAAIGLLDVSLKSKAGATITTTSTDIRGNFSLVAQTGAYDLVFDSVGDKSLEALPSSFTVSADIRVFADTSYSFKAPTTVRLLTSVFSANGEPVSGAHIFSDTYANGTWQVGNGVNATVSSAVGGAVAVTDSNGQVELRVFATAPNTKLVLSAVWVAGGVEHFGTVEVSIASDGTATINLD